LLNYICYNKLFKLRQELKFTNKMTIKTKKNSKIFFLFIYSLFLVAPAILVIQTLESNAADPTPFSDVACRVYEILTGTPGKVVASIVIITIGMGFFTGKVSWGLMIGAAAGIGAMFGAPKIVGFIASDTEAEEVCDYSIDGSGTVTASTDDCNDDNKYGSLRSAISSTTIDSSGTNADDAAALQEILNSSIAGIEVADATAGEDKDKECLKTIITDGKYSGGSAFPYDVSVSVDVDGDNNSFYSATITTK
jgi:type IV secretory pathway VirB2 component (pilin)